MSAPEIVRALRGPWAAGSTPAGRVVAAAMKVVVAALLAWSGYIHYDLYANHGYRYIHAIGPAFLVLAGGSFAVAFLLLIVSRQPDGGRTGTTRRD
jgi:hypothetical protein